MRTNDNRPLWPFFILVFILTIPFWLIGALPNPLATIIPINLPVSALGTFCPLAAALILVYRRDKSVGVQRLMKRVFDFKRIHKKIWYLPVIFFMPASLLLSYGLMRLVGMPLPEPYVPFQMAPVLFVGFFIGATGEEIGWSGYALEPLQERWSALKAGLILGLVWAIWHAIPFIQTQHPFAWVCWQSIVTVLLRMIMIWLYNNTGKSVFAMLLFHTMINLSDFLFPNYGSHYDPMITGLILAGAVALISFLWDSKNLTKFRYAW